MSSALAVRTPSGRTSRFSRLVGAASGGGDAGAAREVVEPRLDLEVAGHDRAHGTLSAGPPESGDLIQDAISKLVAAVGRRVAGSSRPIIVAVDGRSGAGKSTLAAALAQAVGAAVVTGDDFYAGGVAVRDDAPSRRAADCIDWRRQRPVLTALRGGLPGRYHAFDWRAFDGRLEHEAVVVEPAPIIALEGVYSARPELDDLIDLRVLLRVPDRLRLERLVAREGGIGPWERQWHEAEDWYFEWSAPPSWFHLILDAA